MRLPTAFVEMSRQKRVELEGGNEVSGKIVRGMRIGLIEEGLFQSEFSPPVRIGTLRYIHPHN
jgi:hypothetical protein